MTDDPVSPSAAPEQVPPSLHLRNHVLRVVHALQGGYLAGRRPTSASVQQLANLRRALGAAGGSDPRAWMIVLDGMPQALLGRSDGPLNSPTFGEQAAFTALTTYAVHQQSQRSRPMHSPGVSLGRATGLLARQRGREGSLDEGTLGRMHKVCLAHSAELRGHALRSLVTLMRSADTPVPLDYGQLAVDLYWLQQPRYAHGVHLRWGRDVHSRERPTDSETSTADSDTSATASEPAEKGD